MNNQYLTKLECYFLYKKYVKQGYDEGQAEEKIKDFKEQLKKIKLKLQAQNKSREQINLKFREEFEKLCQKLEV